MGERGARGWGVGHCGIIVLLLKYQDVAFVVYSKDYPLHVSQRPIQRWEIGE